MHKQLPLVLAFGFSVLGCGGDGGDEGNGEAQEDNFEAFAAYWADGAEWCEHTADCGGDEAQCLKTWPTAQETERALAAADADPEDVEDCERAAGLLDECALELPCDAPQPNSCMATQENFDIACASVNAALEVYLNEHRGAPFDGLFEGSFDGSESGAFTGELRSDGDVSISIDSPALGLIEGTGHANFSGAVPFELEGDVMDQDFSLSFIGSMYGNSESFDGDGTWESSEGGSGSWLLNSTE
jgi:hypothetical protein